MEALNPVVSCRSRFVALPERALAEFCERWRVQELRLVGSAVHGPFRDDSDLDFVFYAPFRSPIHAPTGQPRREAMLELASLVGRKVDLVCARRTIASANPYAVYNLLVEQRYDRHTGLAWYLQSAARLLSRVSMPSPEQALATMPGRHLLRLGLVRLARTCDSDERIAAWREQGIRDFPFEAVRDAIGPLLANVRTQQRFTWPSDESLAALLHRLGPHFSEVDAAVARRGLPALPAIPRARLDEALGDAPRLQPANARAPSPRSFVLEGGHLRLATAPGAAVTSRWGVVQLAIGGAAADAPLDQTRSAKLVFFAPSHEATYLTPTEIDLDAWAELRAVVGRAGRVLGMQNAVLEGQRVRFFDVLVDVSFAEAVRAS